MDAKPDRREYHRAYRQKLRDDPEKYARVIALQKQRYHKWWAAHEAERAIVSAAKKAEKDALEAPKKALKEALLAEKIATLSLAAASGKRPRGRPPKLLLSLASSTEGSSDAAS